jgi:hypothetical protein
MGHTYLEMSKCASHLHIIKLNVISIFLPGLDSAKENNFPNTMLIFLIITENEFIASV